MEATLHREPSPCPGLAAFSSHPLPCTGSHVPAAPAWLWPLSRLHIQGAASSLRSTKPPGLPGGQGSVHPFSTPWVPPPQSPHVPHSSCMQQTRRGSFGESSKYVLWLEEPRNHFLPRTAGVSQSILLKCPVLLHAPAHSLVHCQRAGGNALPGRRRSHISKRHIRTPGLPSLKPHGGPSRDPDKTALHFMAVLQPCCPAS